MLARAPELETSRLRMRAHRRDDFPHLCELWGDAAVTRYIGGKPFAPDDVWTRLLRNAGHWALTGFGYWVLEETATGRFAGEAGLANLHRDIDPPFGDVPEAGWVLAPWSHGRGFATEAMAAVLDWTDRVLRAERTLCMIDPEHAASLRVAAKLGYREARRSRFKGDAVVVLERAAGEGSSG